MPLPDRRLPAFILLFSFVCIVCPAFGQEPEQPTAEAARPVEILPKSWIGLWEGEVTVESPGGGGGAFSMSLNIQPLASDQNAAGRLTWTIIYDGPQGRSERPYELVPVDLQAGRLMIDEKNGITIDACLIGNSLHSHFTVAGQTIWSRYELQGSDSEPSIRFELLSAQSDTVTKSGGQNGIPVVESIAPRNRQTAILKRVSVDAKGPSGSSHESVPAHITDWQKLDTEPYRGKQDDIYFVNDQIGWYANGAGRIYKTTDSGKTWTKQLDQPGTYFRCLAFIDEQHGFAGNIGPDYFPNVTDTQPLYETKDGGVTWAAVTTIEGPPVVGLCALQILREEFINAGQLETRTRLIGVGRVGGPVAMILSDDLGATWQQIDISQHASMAFDVYFRNRNEGFIAAATSADVAQSNALILRTTDAGKSWEKVYTSSRPYELTWKIAFPSTSVGYVTIQSYNPDPAVEDRYVAKTTDGGQTWTEIPLTKNAAVRQFGIAFLNEELGWIGAVPHGFVTTNGGQTWEKASLGNAVNKIRLIPGNSKTTAFAIGVNIHRSEVP